MMNDELKTRMMAAVDWEKLIPDKNKPGKTQEREEYMRTIFERIVLDMGGEILNKAGSQQAKDYVVAWGDKEITYELKITRDNVKCNDTVPDNETYYVVAKYGKRVVCIVNKVCDRLINSMSTPVACFDKNMGSGRSRVMSEIDVDSIDEIIKKIESLRADPRRVSDVVRSVLAFAMTCVHDRVITLKEFGDLFKINFKFERFTFRPRPNFTVSEKLFKNYE